jgi:hypothetical protein
MESNKAVQPSYTRQLGRTDPITLRTTFVGTFVVSDTTPSVLNVNTWICNNTGAVTITNFTDGQNGQSIRVYGDGYTTIQNGTNIFTNIGADKLLATQAIYRFTFINSYWYEDA